MTEPRRRTPPSGASPEFPEQHWDIYQAALGARSIAELERIVSAFAGTLGFENHAYVAVMAGADADSERPDRFFHDFSNEWRQTIESLRYPWAERMPHAILRIQYRRPPVFWNSLGASNYQPLPDIRRMALRKLQMAGEFRIHGGITVPVHAPGQDWAFLSFTTTARASTQELMSSTLTTGYFAACVQSSIVRLSTGDAIRIPALNDREIAALQWSAMGKTSWEISAILRIGERAVNYHLQQAARKLGTTGRRATAARAIALGLVRL